MNHIYPYWPLLVAVVVVGGVSCLLLVLRMSTRRIVREFRASVLESIKDNEISRICGHCHTDPVTVFLHIERVVKKYGFSEQELGISLDALLSHVEICQLKLLSATRESLEVFQKISFELCNQSLTAEEWAKRAKITVFDPTNQELSKLGKAWSDHLIFLDCRERYRSHRSTDPIQVPNPS